MCQLNGELSKRGVNTLLLMQINKDGDIVTEIIIYRKCILKFNQYGVQSSIRFYKLCKHTSTKKVCNKLPN